MKINVRTTKKRQVIDITDQVQDLVSKSGVKDGSCVLMALHTTAGLTAAEAGPDTNADLLNLLEKIMPEGMDWQHSPGSEHATDHILSSIIGPSLSVVIEDGKLVLGTWQRLALVELDGPKNRDIAITILSSSN